MLTKRFLIFHISQNKYINNTIFSILTLKVQYKKSKILIYINGHLLKEKGLKMFST